MRVGVWHLDKYNVAAAIGVCHEAPGGEQLSLVRRQQQPLERIVVRVPALEVGLTSKHAVREGRQTTQQRETSRRAQTQTFSRRTADDMGLSLVFHAATFRAQPDP